MKDNKLIAEFMGAVGTPKYNPTEWDVYITGCLDVDSDDENAQHFYTPDDMKFHTSWDWLIPVVNKIEMECEGVPIQLIDVSFYDEIHEVYWAVIEFIKEYNKCNKMDTLPPSVQQR